VSTASDDKLISLDDDDEEDENEGEAGVTNLRDLEKMGDDIDDETMDNARPFLMGKAAAVVNEKKSAKAIVDEMVGDAVSWLQKGNSFIISKAKL